MVNIRDLTQQLELSFWNVAINILGDTRNLKFALKRLQKHAVSRTSLRFLLQSVVIATAGLITGVLFGLVLH